MRMGIMSLRGHEAPLSLRGRVSGRGNLPQKSASDCRVGLRPPRNDIRTRCHCEGGFAARGNLVQRSPRPGEVSAGGGKPSPVQRTAGNTRRYLLFFIRSTNCACVSSQ